MLFCGIVRPASRDRRHLLDRRRAQQEGRFRIAGVDGGTRLVGGRRVAHLGRVAGDELGVELALLAEAGSRCPPACRPRRTRWPFAGASASSGRPSYVRRNPVRREDRQALLLGRDDHDRHPGARLGAVLLVERERGLVRGGARPRSAGSRPRAPPAARPRRATTGCARRRARRRRPAHRPGPPARPRTAGRSARPACASPGAAVAVPPSARRASARAEARRPSRTARPAAPRPARHGGGQLRLARCSPARATRGSARRGRARRLAPSRRAPPPPPPRPRAA